MYIKFRTIKDRKQKEHPLRLRDHGPHLRILAILSGHRPKHLACVSTALCLNDIAPTLARCREKLSEVCSDQTEVDRQLARIQERLASQVEATLEARERHHRGRMSGMVVIPDAPPLRLPPSSGARSLPDGSASPKGGVCLVKNRLDS